MNSRFRVCIGAVALVTAASVGPIGAPEADDPSALERTSQGEPSVVHSKPDILFIAPVKQGEILTSRMLRSFGRYGKIKPEFFASREEPTAEPKEELASKEDKMASKEVSAKATEKNKAKMKKR